ncbi:MAG: SDR family NAD(P)-dependent oxidoreductase [Chloroflexota bacterium]
MERARATRVMVTGGASGIGQATALLLVRQGASVLALDVDADAGAALEAEAAGLGDGHGRLAFRRTDVSIEDEVRDAVADARTRLGGLDALVCTAGIMRGQGQAVGTFEAAVWDQVMDVNLRGRSWPSHASAPMLESRAVARSCSCPPRRASPRAAGPSRTGRPRQGPWPGADPGAPRFRGIRINEVCPGTSRPSTDARSRRRWPAAADPAWSRSSWRGSDHARSISAPHRLPGLGRGVGGARDHLHCMSRTLDARDRDAVALAHLVDL